MVTITVSRQFGSGGRKVATEVARLLNYQFFDKQSMIRVALRAADNLRYGTCRR